MSPVPKLIIIRDRKYLDWLHDQPCILTGLQPTEHNATDPLHVGTLGKSIKSSDDECLPVAHHLHVLGHQKGEMSMFREYMPDWLLRECLRAYAREMYREWSMS